MKAMLTARRGNRWSMIFLLAAITAMVAPQAYAVDSDGDGVDDSDRQLYA